MTHVLLMTHNRAIQQIYVANYSVLTSGPAAKGQPDKLSDQTSDAMIQSHVSH